MCERATPHPDVLSPYRGPLAAVGAFSLFMNLLMLALPLYTLQVFDRVLSSRSLETLSVLTLAAVGALVTFAALDLVRSRVLQRVGVWLETELSARALRAGIAEAAGGGARSAQRLREVTELRTFLTGPCILTLFDAPWVPVFVAMIFLMHPALGAVALSGAVLLSAMALLTELTTRRAQAAAGAASVAAVNEAEGFLRHADAIEAMGMLPHAAGRWRRANARSLRPLVIASSRAGLIGSAARLSRLLLQVAVTGVGALLVIRGEITAGAMIAASILMGRALAPVEAAIGSWRSLASARAAHQRLSQALVRPRLRGAMRLPPPAGGLSVERLAFTPPRGGRPVLQGLSFVLEPGEVLGIIGPSAAGKSTLGRLIVGVWRPSRGTVRLDGADVYAWDPDDLGRHVGYLPQDVQLFAGTVRENIGRLDPGADPGAVVRAARMAGVHEMVLSLPQGYETEVGDGGAMLSGGQRQRIGLARALFGEPRLLVLDEPNAHLDGPGEQALQSAVAAARAAGTTVVIIAHRPSAVGQADKLLLLRDGMVEMFGPRLEVWPRITRQASRPAQPHLATVAPPTASGNG